MEKIDPKKARAVWQRVMEAKHRRPPMPPRPPVPPQPPAPEEPSQEELRQWLAEIAALVRGYRSMNAGRFTPRLRRMAAEEQAHYRRLAALYFRLYGWRPEVLSGAAPGSRGGLRQTYEAEQRAVRQWKEAAARYPSQRALFESFARDDRRHAAQIGRILPVNPRK